MLNASDIFVYPITLSYGYALAFLEAMATGLPGVITDVGPTKELTVNDYNGMVVPLEDVESLTNALRGPIEDEELREQIGKNARKVVGVFLLKLMKELYLTILLNLVVSRDP